MLVFDMKYTIHLVPVPELKYSNGICSFKKYTVDAYKDAPKKVNFPNYELFNDVNEAYSNFFQKIRIVLDSIAPFKTKRVKANTQKWFDR